VPEPQGVRRVRYGIKPSKQISSALPNTINRVLGLLGKDPDKTFIGRIERGFDSLGCRFTPAGPPFVSNRSSIADQMQARMHALWFARQERDRPHLRKSRSHALVHLIICCSEATMTGRSVDCGSRLPIPAAGTTRQLPTSSAAIVAPRINIFERNVIIVIPFLPGIRGSHAH
jgi:hypothetical protein